MLQKIPLRASMCWLLVCFSSLVFSYQSYGSGFEDGDVSTSIRPPKQCVSASDIIRKIEDTPDLWGKTKLDLSDRNITEEEMVQLLGFIVGCDERWSVRYINLANTGIPNSSDEELLRSFNALLALPNIDIVDITSNQCACTEWVRCLDKQAEGKLVWLDPSVVAVYGIGYEDTVT